MRRRALLLVAAAALAACGGNAASPEAQRAVAGQFARALVEGRAASAQSLLADGVDPVVPELVRRLARRPGGVLRSSGAEDERNQWVFAYFRQVTKPDGSFTRESGQVVVDLTGGHSPAVKFFGLRNREIAYSTHHDAQLMPSKR